MIYANFTFFKGEFVNLLASDVCIWYKHVELDIQTQNN